MATPSATATGPGQQSSHPQILLVSLAYQSWQDEVYCRLFDMLREQAQLECVKGRGAALRFLADNQPRAIIATDEGITNPRNSPVLDRVIQYARGGGTVILGLMFPCIAKFDDIDATFAGFGLPWKCCMYRRSTFTLNHPVIQNLNCRDLLPEYSQKALRVSSIDAQNAVYLERLESEDEDADLPSSPVYTEGAPVAWAKIEKGYLGYIGDVNGEEGSDRVVMAMCGL